MLVLLAELFERRLRGGGNSPIKVGVDADISIAISVPSFELNITPNTAVSTTAGTVSVTTNNYTGYTLSMSMADWASSNALMHTNPNYQIDALDGTTTASDFPFNKWGYSLDGGANFTVPPAIGATQVLKTTTAASIADPTQIHLGTRVDSTMISGDYYNAIKFTAVTNALPAPTNFDEAFLYSGAEKDPNTGLYKMQDMTNSVCASVPSPTSATAGDEQTTTLVDTRDNKTYTIAKLMDDKCWMTQNLDLDLNTTTALTNENTNLTSVVTWIPERNTIPTGSLSSSTWINDYNHPYSYDPGDEYYYTSGTTSNDTEYTSLSACTAAGHSESDCKHYHEGNYYNWSAAVASNDTSSHTTSEETMPDSICPKGWRLPQSSSDPSEFGTLLYQSGIITSPTASGTSAYTTDGFNNIRTTPLWFVRSGRVYDGSRLNLGSYGRYWSSAVLSSSRAYSLFVYSSDISPRYDNSRNNGYSVRCLAQ